MLYILRCIRLFVRQMAGQTLRSNWKITSDERKGPDIAHMHCVAAATSLNSSEGRWGHSFRHFMNDSFGRKHQMRRKSDDQMHVLDKNCNAQSPQKGSRHSARMFFFPFISRPTLGFDSAAHHHFSLWRLLFVHSQRKCRSADYHFRFEPFWARQIHKSLYS